MTKMQYKTYNNIHSAYSESVSVSPPGDLWQTQTLTLTLPLLVTIFWRLYSFAFSLGKKSVDVNGVGIYTPLYNNYNNNVIDYWLFVPVEVLSMQHFVERQYFSNILSK